MLPQVVRRMFIVLTIICLFVIGSVTWMCTSITSCTVQHSLGVHLQEKFGIPSVLPFRKGASGGGKQTCKPQQKLVYLKTHKTGSTTLGSVIQRYGYYHNLTFLVPRSGHFINYHNIFNASKIEGKAGSGAAERFRDGYDLLANHARFSKSEMDKVFSSAKYVTILREPSTQFESAFNYFEIWRSLPRTREPLRLFMDSPRRYFDMVMKTRQYYKESMHNQHLFDLGMQQKDMDDEGKIAEKIREIDAGFDLVMITEYFDESLLLLRKLMCWRMDNIVYLKKATRSPNYRMDIDENMRTKIRAWNHADVALYAHFNQTFWRKVKEYGATFQSDLAQFKGLLTATYDKCTNKMRNDTRDRRVVKISLKNDAPEECRYLLWGDVEYTKIIHKRMDSTGVPMYDNRENDRKPRKKKTRKKKSI